MKPVLTVAADTPVHAALRTMRKTRDHLALVIDDHGEVAGLITLTDVLQRLLPAGQT